MPLLIYSMRREYGTPSSPRTTTLENDFFFKSDILPDSTKFSISCQFTRTYIYPRELSCSLIFSMSSSERSDSPASVPDDGPVLRWRNSFNSSSDRVTQEYIYLLKWFLTINESKHNRALFLYPLITLFCTSTILPRFSSERSAIISMSIVILAYPKRFTAIPPTTRYLTPTDSNSLNISSYIIITYYLWQDKGVNGVPGIIYSMRREYGTPSSPRTTTLGDDFFFFIGILNINSRCP